MKYLSRITVKLVFAILISIFFSCSNADDNKLEFEMEVKNSNEFQNKLQTSTFVYSMLMAKRIVSVDYNKGVYSFTTINNEKIDVTNSNSTIEKVIYLNYLNLGKNMKVTFHNSTNNYKISVYDINSKKTVNYFDISGATEDLDESLTMAALSLYYIKENPEKNYQGTGNCDTQTYWCFKNRRSECSSPINFITEYCGGTPYSISGSDCGCAWEDFACVCVTDFIC